jgi:hypothetical protein
VKDKRRNMKADSSEIDWPSYLAEAIPNTGGAVERQTKTIERVEEVEDVGREDRGSEY